MIGVSLSEERCGNGIIAPRRYFKNKASGISSKQGFFNTSGEIIGRPIMKQSVAGPLHIWMSTEENEGYIQCTMRKTGTVRFGGTWI